MGYRLTDALVARGHRAALYAAQLVLYAMLLVVCVPVPATAAFGDFTIKDEVELGRQIKASVRNHFPLIEDPEIVAYANEVLHKLMAQVPPQPFVFSINIIRHNAINAFATPGGNLFLFTGLILAMEHESEMAGVLAHEIAHATQRHIAGRIAQNQRMTLLSLAGAILGGFLGGEGGMAIMSGSLAAGQAAQLKYSRADETDADHVGMNYFIKAGYPPRGVVGAFEKIRRQQWLVGSNIPTYLSSHPGIQERINFITTRINALPATIRNRKDDDTKFLRIQTLIRARYSDPQLAMNILNRQTKAKGSQRCYAHMGLGMLHSRQNRVNEAEKAFDNALACASDDSLIAREAGIFHYAKGSKGKALAYLSRAMELNSRDYMAQFYYARLQADSGNTATALDYYERILRYLPDDPEVHQFYAQVLGRDKQLFRAYLHLAYSSLYANDKRRTEQNLARAQKAAKTPDDETALKRFEAAFKERRELFEKK